MKRHGVPIPVPERPTARPEVRTDLRAARLPGPALLRWLLQVLAQLRGGGSCGPPGDISGALCLLKRRCSGRRRGLVPAGLQWPRCSGMALGTACTSSSAPPLSLSPHVTFLSPVCLQQLLLGLRENCPFPPQWPTLLCSPSPDAWVAQCKTRFDVSQKHLAASPGGLLRPASCVPAWATGSVPAWATGSREGRAGPSDSSWASWSSLPGEDGK